MPTEKRDEPTNVTETVTESALDAVLHHVALEAMEHDASTERHDRWANGLHQKMQSQIAALRHQRVPARAAISPIEQIPTDYQGLVRKSLLARIEALRHSGSVRYAPLEVTRLSDDDLRRLLATLEPPIEPE
jgi:hypothetical protein